MVKSSGSFCRYLWTQSDDILVTGNHFDRIEQLHKELNDAFSITINGKLKEVTCEKFVDSFLGILVTGRTENGSITLSVPGKINDLVKETETATGTKLHSIKLLSAPDKDSKPKSGKLYDHVKENFSRIIGCCIYMSITCRQPRAFQRTLSETMMRPQEHIEEYLTEKLTPAAS